MLRWMGINRGTVALLYENTVTRTGRDRGGGWDTGVLLNQRGVNGD